MKERQRRSFIVGVFVIVGLMLFIFAIYLIGTKEYVFGQPKKVSAIFNDVKGLKEGDKIRMSGIDIGTVNSLLILENTNVLVQLSIDKEQFAHIKEGSKVLIGSQGLMGAKVVKIMPGELQGNPVAEHDTLGTLDQVEIDDLVRQLSGASSNITIVTEELVEISQKINRGEGIFGKLLSDKSMDASLENTIVNIEKIIENFNDISEKISQGQGLVGKLIADTTLSSGGESINDIASNLKDITDKINRGDGIFGQLFTDTTLMSSLYFTSKNLQSTTENLMVMTDALNNDSSALNLLIDDPSFADSLEVMIERLNIGIIEATQAAEAVQRSGIIRLGGKKKKEKK